MAEWILAATAVSISLVYWGLLRTALWLILPLFLVDATPFVSASHLCFFAAASLFAQYRKGMFDFRGLDKSRWVFILFLTGFFSGSLLYPTSPSLFMGSALLPLISLALFKIFRMPVSTVYFFPRYIRWLAPSLLIVNFLIKGYQMIL